VTSRYFTPRRCHASHAVTGAIGVASAFALPGTVASSIAREPGRHALVVLHPAGQIDVEVELKGRGGDATVERAALVRTARKIMQGELHLPEYVFSRPEAAAKASSAFPHKPVTIIVPTRAGGGNDMMARIIAARLGPLLGREVLVDNRAGANGGVASEYVAHAEPDGHTLLFGYIGTHSMNPALQKVGYDPIADFAPIGMVGSSPTLMVAHPTQAPADVASLIASLKNSPRRFGYASAGDGTPPHFAAELFQLSTGTAMAGCAYEGAAPAIADTVAGRAQVMFPSLFTAHPFLHAGQLRALAVTGPRRLAGLEGVPTLAEVGVAGVDVAQWYGLFAPAGTPAAVIDRLNLLLNQVLRDPEVIERFQSHGARVEPGTPDALSSKVRAALARWSQVVKKAGLAPQESRVATLD
jgi:tripartite-type tricarboxylate transporter receptor subunit TctC